MITLRKEETEEKIYRTGIDVTSVILFLCGVVAGLVWFFFVSKGMSAWVLVPAIIAMITGATHFITTDVRPK